MYACVRTYVQTENTDLFLFPYEYLREIGIWKMPGVRMYVHLLLDGIPFCPFTKAKCLSPNSSSRSLNLDLTLL